MVPLSWSPPLRFLSRPVHSRPPSIRPWIWPRRPGHVSLSSGAWKLDFFTCQVSHASGKGSPGQLTVYRERRCDRRGSFILP